MPIVSVYLGTSIPDRAIRHRLGREDVVRYALVAIFGFVLYLFVLYPMAHLAWRSLLSNDGGYVGLANYARYFRTPAIAASITNSLFVSIVSMAITVTLAFVYASGLTRTLMPWRGLFRRGSSLFDGADNVPEFAGIVEASDVRQALRIQRDKRGHDGDDEHCISHGSLTGEKSTAHGPVPIVAPCSPCLWLRP